VEERADLAGSLIESLEESQDSSVDATWDEEVTRRMADIDSGKVTPVSLEEARQRLSSTLEWGWPILAGLVYARVGLVFASLLLLGQVAGPQQPGPWVKL
jgi:putative addiction module component (TIGR02574 family)